MSFAFSAQSALLFGPKVNHLFTRICFLWRIDEYEFRASVEKRKNKAYEQNNAPPFKTELRINCLNKLSYWFGRNV